MGMKILLTVPLPSLISGPFPILPDLGLGYLATHLETQGHDVTIHDWNSLLSPQEFKSYLGRLAPIVVGIKVFTFNIPAVIATLELIRQACPTAQIVLGGPHISATDPEEIFVDFPQASYAFRGEAETSLPRLVAYLEGKPENLEAIPGLIWQQDGQLKSNQICWEDHLDLLGLPAWPKIDPRRYRPDPIMPGVSGPNAPVIMTRGCPGSCGFCSVHRISGKKVRTRSPDRLLDEIEYLVKEFQIRQLMFMDTNFLYNRDLAALVCEGLIRRGLNLEWDCVSDVSWYKCDPSLYHLMARAGCQMMQIGIESGSDRIRQLIGQYETVQEVRRQIDHIKQAGIKVRGWFLLGFPEETREDMWQTIRLAFSLKLFAFDINLCYPLPGTNIYNWLREHYQIPRIDWATFDIRTSPYPLSRLSSSELTRLWRTVQMRIFWNPRTLMRKVASRIRTKLPVVNTLRH